MIDRDFRKRILVALGAVLILVLILCLSTCGKTKAKKVGVCLQNSAYCALLQQTLTDAGYEVLVAEAAADQSRQNEKVASFISQQVDLLIVEPFTQAGADALAGQAKQAGIPAVFVGTQPENAGGTVSFVGVRKEEQGALQSGILLQNADKGDRNGDGVISYLIITGPEEDAFAQQYAKSSAEALAQTGLENAAISVEWTDGTQESARKACARLLAQYGKDVEVILCFSDVLAQGALAAIENGGWQVGKDYYLLGIGGTDAALELVKNGKLTGTVWENYPLQAQTVGEVAGKLLSGQAVEKEYYVNCQGVNWENLPALRSESKTS